MQLLPLRTGTSLTGWGMLSPHPQWHSKGSTVWWLSPWAPESWLCPSRLTLL